MGNCCGGSDDGAGENKPVDDAPEAKTEEAPKPEQLMAQKSVATTEDTTVSSISSVSSATTVSSTFTPKPSNSSSELLAIKHETSASDKDPELVFQKTNGIHSDHKERMAARMGVKLKSVKEPHFKYTRKVK